MRELLILLNPKAGAGGEVPTQEHLRDAVARAGGDARVARLDGETVEALLARHDPEGRCVAVAAGGDGTVRSVAAARVGSGRPVGVLPLGTRNHFARDAGIPLALPEAIDTLLRGRETEVDAAEVAGRLFLNNASLGLYPDFVVERRRRLEKGARWSAIAGAAWWVLQQRRRLRIAIAGDDTEHRASILFVGNNAYETEGIALGSRAALDEGVLTLVLVGPSGPWSAVRLTLRALFGRLQAERDYRQWRARSLDIDIRRSRLRVALDGEPCWMTPPLHFRMRPRSLVVLTPGDR